MKSVSFVNKVRTIWVGVIGLLLFSVVVILSCGKLQEETAPSDPIGTTGGVAVPIGEQRTMGGVTFSMYATPDTIPADRVTFATIHAKLEDASGRSMENFRIFFTSDLGFVVNDPSGPSYTWAHTASARTNEWGTASVFYYGGRAGSEIIYGCVDIDSQGSCEQIGLSSTTLITVTAAPGVPGSGVPGVYLTVNPNFRSLDLGDCADPKAVTGSFDLTATVWDEAGSRAGSGVQVLLSGDLPPYTIGEGLTDTNGQAKWTVTYSVDTPGVYTFTARATVVINGVTYTDDVTYAIEAKCKAAAATPTPTGTTVTLTASANPAATTGGAPATISVYALAGSNPVPDHTVIRFSASASGADAVFTSHVLGTPNVAEVETFGGVASDVLTYTGTRPATITVYFTVVTSGYSGTASVTVTFNP
jgi:hypothetical protein